LQNRILQKPEKGFPIRALSVVHGEQIIQHRPDLTGSSIPHIEVEDLKEFLIPRLDTDVEQEIAELAEGAFTLWVEADETENQLARLADSEIESLLCSKE